VALYGYPQDPGLGPVDTLKEDRGWGSGPAPRPGFPVELGRTLGDPKKKITLVPFWGMETKKNWPLLGAGEPKKRTPHKILPLKQFSRGQIWSDWFGKKKRAWVLLLGMGFGVWLAGLNPVRRPSVGRREEGVRWWLGGGNPGSGVLVRPPLPPG
jgi:hypothetical protein